MLTWTLPTKTFIAWAEQQADNGRYGRYVLSSFQTHAGTKRFRLSTYTRRGIFTGNRSFRSIKAAKAYVELIEKGA